MQSKIYITKPDVFIYALEFRVRRWIQKMHQKKGFHHPTFREVSAWIWIIFLCACKAAKRNTATVFAVAEAVLVRGEVSALAG